MQCNVLCAFIALVLYENAIVAAIYGLESIITGVVLVIYATNAVGVAVAAVTASECNA